MSVRTDEFRRGWPLLATAIVCNGTGVACIPYYGLSSFIGPLREAFGWTAGQIGIAVTVVTIGIFLTGPIVGRLCDRHGVRVVALPSMVLLSLTFAALTAIGGSVLTLYLGFGLLALLGAGTTSVAYSRAVNTWFVHSRGLALGLMMTGSGLAAALLPSLLGGFIADYGWRAGFLACAAIALLPLPLAIPLLREGTVAAEAAQTKGPLPGMSIAEVVSTRQFWMMMIAAFLVSAASGGVIVHLIPMLTGEGLTVAAASRAAGLIGIGIILGRLGVGYLLDRVNGPPLAAALMLLTVLGFVMLAVAPAETLPWSVLLVGLALGSEGDMLAYFATRYFGLSAYSELFGWLYGAMALGAAAGPLLVILWGLFGGFPTVMAAFAVQVLVSAALFGLLGRYRY